MITKAFVCFVNDSTRLLVHELSTGVCGLSRHALVFVSKIGIGRIQRFVLHQLVFELEVYIGVNSSPGTKYQCCVFPLRLWVWNASLLIFESSVSTEPPSPVSRINGVTSSSQKPLPANDSIQWRFSRHSPGNIVNPHQC